MKKRDIEKRRYLLRMIATGGVTVGVAGCLSESDGQSGPEEPNDDSPDNEETEGDESSTDSDEENSQEDESEGPNFELNIRSIPEEILQGDIAQIVVSAQNTGDEGGKVEISVSIAGSEKFDSVSLDPDETQDVNFEFETQNLSGDHTVEITSSGEGDTISEDIEIVPPEIDISYELPDVLLTGTEQNFDINITNQTNVEITTNIAFKLSTVERDTDITLPPNETGTISFDYTVPDQTGPTFARVASTTTEEVSETEVQIAELNNIYDIVLERDGFECAGQSVSNYVETLNWELEVSTTVNVHRDGDLHLQITFIDADGRMVGGADVSGSPPTPDTPVVWGMENTDLDNEECGDATTWDQPCCEYGTRIADSLDEGGTVQVSEASYE